MVKIPTVVPSALVARKVTTVPSVTIPTLRSRVAVTWILVLTAAVAIGMSTAAVMTFGKARSKRMEASRVTPFTVAVTRAEVIWRGLTRSAEALPPPSAGTWTEVPEGANVPAVVWNVTWRDPAGRDGDTPTVNVEIVAPSAGARSGALTNWIVWSGWAAPKAIGNEAVMPGASAGQARTTAVPTCCELTRSTVACPLPSAGTITQPVQLVTGVPPTSVPLDAENTTVRLAKSGSPTSRATRRRREKPSAGRLVAPFSALRTTMRSTCAAVGE